MRAGGSSASAHRLVSVRSAATITIVVARKEARQFENVQAWQPLRSHVAAVGRGFGRLAKTAMLRRTREGDRRGDKTPLELFMSGVGSWPTNLVFAAEALMANLAP